MTKKVIFMGTPEFAVASLNELLDKQINVVAVVTAPDRPAGRGQKLSMSAVKKFALSKNLPILQPEKLKSPEFIENLKSYNADLFVVVAFRMLPEIVWSMPPLGTINLHGSLLPNYRGAAPINWAVINGEKETGVTTFFIEKEIDTGKIIDKETICITDKDTAGSVHDKLMQVGAKLLAKTVKNILNGSVKAIPQTDLDLSAIKHAPKIFKPDCKLDWSKDSLSVYNKIRGLSPYPTAWTVVENKEDQSRKTIKLFEVDYIIDNQNNSYQIKIEHKKVMFGTANGWIILKDVQLEGKKRMPIEALMNGFDFTKYNLLNE